VTLEERIDEIADGAWWKTDSRDEYLLRARQLVGMGMTEEDAANFVGVLYYAAAECFGGC
jgi:hypothetical protein